MYFLDHANGYPAIHYQPAISCNVANGNSYFLVCHMSSSIYSPNPEMSRVELLFPPTAALPQIKSGISFISSISTCCFLRHVFICPIDHSHSFPYSLFVTNRKRERTAPPTVRSFSSPIQVLQSRSSAGSCPNKWLPVI